MNNIYAQLAALALASKLAQFLIDRRALLQIDSGGFFLNATGTDFMPERSYFYGWLLRIFAMPFTTLTGVVAMQMLAGALTAFVLGLLLWRHGGVSRRWTLAAVALFSWEPTQIVHEHLILTESVAGFAAAVLLLLCLEDIRKPDWRWLPLMSLAGFVMVGVRLVYVPMVFAAALLLPWFAGWPRPLSRFSERVGASALAVAMVYAGQAGYRHLTGWMGGRPPAYHFRTGFFLFGAVVPIVTPLDTNDQAVRRLLERQMVDRRNPLAEVSTSNRENHLWLPAGLTTRIAEAKGMHFWVDRYRVSEPLGEIAVAAMKRDPLGYLYIALVGLAEWCPIGRDLAPNLKVEQGSDPDNNVVPNIHTWHLIGPRFPDHNADNVREATPSRLFHRKSTPWLWLQFCSPLIGLAASVLAWRRTHPAFRLAVWLTFWSAAMMAVVCFTTAVAIRYLHPLSFPAFGLLAIVFDALPARPAHNNP